jgi:hypothetical protein
MLASRRLCCFGVRPIVVGSAEDFVCGIGFYGNIAPRSFVLVYGRTVVCAVINPEDKGVVRGKDRSMMTTVWRWLGHRLAGRPLPADEFRADRMDAAWKPEYQHIARQERPALVAVPYLFYR